MDLLCTKRSDPAISNHSLDSKAISRNDFPPGFKFGAATSAYQIEGAALEDGRDMSIWDSFCHIRGNISDGSTGNQACNHYHLYKEDVQLMVDLGIDFYKLSLSWSRIFLDGTGVINQNGVAFYNKLISNLLHNGIVPYVTLNHWDTPQALENDPDIKGWRTKEIVKHFAHYAETCFKLFGDRVKNWFTLNEILTFATDGYGTGTDAPGRCSAICGTSKEFYVGDSSTEPYLCAHHALLAHAAAVRIYKSRYQAEQGGRIGLIVNCKWFEPYSATKEDADAAQRCMEFGLGWMLDPILRGNYPESMRAGAGNRLPVFSEDEKGDLMGSLDFIGYNYYTARYCRNALEVEPSKRWYSTDRLAVEEYVDINGKWIGKQYNSWLYNCPWGLPKVLEWMEDRYGKEQFVRTPILITENGAMDTQEDISCEEALDDCWRISYLNDTLSHLAVAMREKNYSVEAYSVWSLLDNFEWSSGLSCRFGLYYVDYENYLKRYPKSSALWYKKFLNTNDSKHALRCSKPLSSEQKSELSTSTTRSRGCLGFAQRPWNVVNAVLGILFEIMKSPNGPLVLRDTKKPLL